MQLIHYFQKKWCVSKNLPLLRLHCLFKIFKYLYSILEGIIWRLWDCITVNEGTIWFEGLLLLMLWPKKHGPDLAVRAQVAFTRLEVTISCFLFVNWANLRYTINKEWYTVSSRHCPFQQKTLLFTHERVCNDCSKHSHLSKPVWRKRVLGDFYLVLPSS